MTGYLGDDLIIDALTPCLYRSSRLPATLCLLWRLCTAVLSYMLADDSSMQQSDDLRLGCYLENAKHMHGQGQGEKRFLTGHVEECCPGGKPRQDDSRLHMPCFPNL